MEKFIYRKSSTGTAYYRIGERFIEGFTIVDLKDFFKLVYERYKLPERKELGGFINSTLHCTESEYAEKLGEYSVRHDEVMLDSLLPCHIAPMMPEPKKIIPTNPEKDDCA